jgi:hypothetical protein
MSTKLTGWDDTIVVPATPPGIGALLNTLINQIIKKLTGYE